MHRIVLLVALGATLLFIGLAGMVAQAGAHFYSYNSGIDDARYAVLLECPGDNADVCGIRYDPFIRTCYSHSWCWEDSHTHAERPFWQPWWNWRGSAGQAAHGELLWHVELQ